MKIGLAEEIYERAKNLAPTKQLEVLRFIERKTPSPDSKSFRPIWEEITEISSEISLDEWKKLPSDGSANHDHYLYGAPKKY